MVRLLFILVAASGALCAQIDSDAITVTASRSIHLPLDRLLFTINVRSAVDATLDDVGQALRSSGVSGAVFTNVNTPYSYLGVALPLGLDWTFELRAPLANLKATLALLDTARQKSQIALTYSVQSESGPLACSPADLLADATARARLLASAAGVGLGPVLAMAMSMTDAVLPRTIVLPTASFRTGNFTPQFVPTDAFIPISSSLVTSIPIASIPTASCALKVKFQLLRP